MVSLDAYIAQKSRHKDMLALKEIMTILQKNGGILTKKQIKQEIRETSKEIPEEYLSYFKTSEKTGKPYRPFAYDFNYALKILFFSDLIEQYTRLSDIVLTTKGREFQISEPSVFKIRDGYYKSIKKSNIKINNSSGAIESEVIEEDWRELLLDSLKNMSPKKFEKFSRMLVSKMGIDIDEQKGISYTSDGGIDGYGYIMTDDFRTNQIAIQAKRYTKNNVGSVEVQNFIGAISSTYKDAAYGIFITTSGFNKNAVETARKSTKPVTLIDGDSNCDLVEKYQLYVKPVTTYELGEFYLTED